MENQDKLEVTPLPEDKAHKYWDNLIKNGLVGKNGKRWSQIGHPIEVTSSFVEQLNRGAQSCTTVLG